jgi:tRNA 2-thiocytidine biosynthesis protein TtcA
MTKRLSSEAQRLRRKLSRAMAQAIHDFSMIADGDRILCAVSGGKDSYTMLDLLEDLRRRAPVRFELLAVNVDQGHPDVPGQVLHGYLQEHAYQLHVVRDDTYSIVRDKVPQDKTSCSLCSRLRRAILYRSARELGCSKIALGHHREDVLVTLLLNLIFAGQLKAMPPKLVSDDAAHIVIRPLSYCAEADIAAYAAARGFPLVPCGLCSSQQSQRVLIGQLLADLEQRQPGVKASMLAALRNVRPSHLLDQRLWAQLGLTVAQESDDWEP